MMEAERRVAADVRLLPVALLDEAEVNPNKMDPGVYEALRQAIDSAGFLQPILVRPGSEDGRFEIVDGHHRVRVAKDLGIEQVPAVVEPMDKEWTLAARLGLNRLRGTPDLEAVSGELRKLAAYGWGVEDVALTGWNQQDVQDLLAAYDLDGDSALADAAAVPLPEGFEVEEERAPAAVFLEVGMASAAELRAVKRALRKAAGKGKDLRAGLLRVLAMDERKEADGG